MSKPTLYAILGVASTTSQAEIADAFSRLKDDHQERIDHGDAQARMDLFNIRAAYDVLISPERRSDYDESLARAQFAPETPVPNPPRPFLQPKATSSVALTACPACGGKLSATAAACPHCGHVNTAAGVTHAPMLAALAGSVLLAFGVFAPIVQVPIVGGVNLYRDGTGDGVILLVIAAITVVLALLHQYRALWITGSASLALVLYTFVNLQIKLGEVKTKLNDDLEGNPFRGLADAAVGSIQLQWGFVPLVIGAVLVVVAAWLARKR